MNNILQTELDTLAGIINNTVPVERIYLFGSYACGTPHKDSDLDLYVVLKDDTQMRMVDAAVFGLYGLTAEEIKAVEGRE
jgi:predicted nucleotidyltransferase